MATLDFDAPLSRYFKDEIVQSFHEHDITSLDDVYDLVVGNPRNWASVLGWNEAQANGLIKWLYDNQKGNFEVSKDIEKKAKSFQSPYYATKESIEDISANRWEHIVNKESINRKKRIGERQESTILAPLEAIHLPASVDGSDGTNRGLRQQCALEATCDTEAIKSWLKARANNPNTLTAYRKESERFLLWSVLEKQTALSSLNIEQCSDYLRWLEQLGRTDETEWEKRWRQPQSLWVGPKNVSRSSGDWRPFNNALSFSSRKAAVTIIRQLFSFLQKTGYLRFNPFDQISTKIPLLPGEGKPKEFADRSLSEQQWEEILNYLDKMPDSITKARLKVILLLGKGLGMRASEMLNARCSWIHFSSIHQTSNMATIDIVGKGDKERRLPLSEEQLGIINDYLQYRKLTDITDATLSQVPILASMKPRKKGSSDALSRSGLYLILSNFLEEVARSIQKERPVDASKLRTSSTHWLRHTFAVTSLKVMPVNIVQTAMGHASVGTTSRYIMPDQREMFEAMKKKSSI